MGELRCLPLESNHSPLAVAVPLLALIARDMRVATLRREQFRTPSYVRSLCSQFSFIEFIANSRSGQFFFYSADGKYMIKTQTKEECTFLRRILPHYYRHVIQNPATMLTRFYGMHRVKMHHIRRKMRFVVMGSVFATREDVKCMFDVKGSTVGRFAKPGERVLKDCDLHRMGPDGAPLKLRLGHGRREHFLMQASPLSLRARGSESAPS